MNKKTWPIVFLAILNLKKPYFFRQRQDQLLLLLRRQAHGGVSVGLQFGFILGDQEVDVDPLISVGLHVAAEVLGINGGIAVVFTKIFNVLW